VAAGDPYLTLAFSLASSADAYALLVGAGVSKGAGLPSAWDIEVDLVRQIAQRDNASVVIDNDNAEQWYSDNYHKALTYSSVVEEVARTPHERRALLEKYFEDVDVDGNRIPFPPSAAHRAVARLVEAGIIRVIVTMNFDRLFEAALLELRIQPTVVATEDDAEGLGPLRLHKACVIHLHGDYRNAMSMLNTTAELSGYQPHMRDLLRRVLGDYGLIVAGWSVQHDHALRNAVSASYTKRFTTGWVEPGPLTDAALELTKTYAAEVIRANANDAFEQLAAQVFAIREKQARHPLTVNVAANRVKRHLTQQSPAISAHDMVSDEFNRLHELPEFNLSDYNNLDTGYAQQLRGRVVEATRIPAAIVAVLAYWGGNETERWWTQDVERLARVVRHGGSSWLINLPLVAASMLFYSAGVAAICTENYGRVASTVFALHGEPVDHAGSVPATAMLVPNPSKMGMTAADHYQSISPTIVEALGLRQDVVEDAWQLFEILRLTSELINSDVFVSAVILYDLEDRRATATANIDPTIVAAAEARRSTTLNGVADTCHPNGLHLLAVEKVYTPGAPIQWGSPVAERLAAEVSREGDKHPVAQELRGGADNIELALKIVSRAVGRAADGHPANTPPPGGGVMPDRIWLDT
jgi:NAD-dependent SIR2 family protein deacetylase